MRYKWKDVSIKKYNELASIPNEMDDVERMARAVAVLDGVEYEKTRSYDLVTLNRRMEDANSLLITEPKARLKKSWDKYKFTLTFSGIDFGQYTDLEKLGNEDFAGILAVLTKPDTPEEFLEIREDILERCPIEIAKGISEFFFAYSLKLEKIRATSSMKKTGRKKKETISPKKLIT